MILKQKTLLGFVLSSLFILSSPLARGEQNPIQTKDIINDKTSPVIDRKQQLNQGNPYDIGVIKLLDPNSGVYNRPIWLNLNEAGEYPRSTDDTAYLCRSALRVSRNLEEILSACPRLAMHTVWQRQDGTIVPYPNWRDDQKARIESIFQALVRGESNLGLNCPNPNLGSDPIINYRTEQQGFDIYVAHVAHVFYLEKYRLVPWSILNFPDAALAELLSSQRYFTRVTFQENHPGYKGQSYPLHVLPEEYGSYGSICDPRVGRAFLMGNNSTLGTNLIGSTPEETLAKITLWAARNFRHETRFDRERSHDLAGRLRATTETRFIPERRREYNFSYIPLHAACKSAARILRDLARAINLPLLIVHSSDLDPHILEPSLYSSTQRRYNFLDMSHSGLMTQWNNPPLILYHADLLYADLPFPALLTSSVGVAIEDESAIEQSLLQNFWQTPETLQSWSFQFLPDVPEVISGAGYGIYNANSDTGMLLPLRSFGRFIGFWRGPTVVPNGTISVFRKIHSYNLKYEFCSIDRYIDNYCDLSEDGFLRQIRSSIAFDRMSELPLSYRRTPEQYRDRAESCVIAYDDDCNYARNLAIDWQLSELVNSWRD